MKIPKDSPTKVGDRVCQRKDPDLIGTVVRIGNRPAWMFVLWDEVRGPPAHHHGPGICHQNELQVVSE